MKKCRSCDKEKKLSKFVKLSSSDDGHTNICLKCHRKAQQRYRKANPDKYKSIKLKSKYGITLEEVNQMKEKQKNKCGICKTEDNDLHIDHCHDKGHVRGLLCHKCNKALGFFMDDTDNLHKAIVYLVRNEVA